MHIALTLPNVVLEQELAERREAQFFGALGADSLNTSFFIPNSAQVTEVASATADLASSEFSKDLKAIASEHRIIQQLNEEFLKLEFSVRDFNRVSSSSDDLLSIVKPPVRSAEKNAEEDKERSLLQVDQELQVAA